MRCRCAALQSYLQPSASALYAAKAPALDRSRVFALFFWRRLPVLDLTEGDIGKQLSELALSHYQIEHVTNLLAC